jgi:hypothetical protein
MPNEILFIIIAIGAVLLLLLMFLYSCGGDTQLQEDTCTAAKHKREAIEKAFIERNKKINVLRYKLDTALQEAGQEAETRKALKGKNSCDQCGAPAKSTICEYCSASNI